MIDVPSALWDGDCGPVLRFTLKDDGTVVDQNACAVEVYVYDEDQTLLARRVGIPVSPKTDGKIDLLFLGRECDADGAGRSLILKPKIYFAASPTGTAATNVLANASRWPRIAYSSRASSRVSGAIRTLPLRPR